MGNEAKKILLVQLFSNGDCLYTTAIARQVKKDFPGCNLTWAIAPFCSDIIRDNPFVDHVLIVDNVPKNDIVQFRKFKKQVLKEKKDGKWDEVFIVSNMDSNQALYDGTIRGMIFRAYPFPITVPVQPVLNLTESEAENVRSYAELHKLHEYRNVILWEYAPQSGQSKLHFDFVKQVAKRISEIPSTCILLSSANRFESSEKIIDASSLTVRENAALTHYCSLLIGCSSGITWLSTSSAARFLPMVQLLDPYTAFLNPPSLDFKRFNIQSNGLIEMISINEDSVFNCVKCLIGTDFNKAYTIYNQTLPLQFNTTRKIVYNLLCYMQFGAIRKHYKIITSIYGRHPEFLKQFYLAIAGFPLKLVTNLFLKTFRGLTISFSVLSILHPSFQLQAF